MYLHIATSFFCVHHLITVNDKLNPQTVSRSSHRQYDRFLLGPLTHNAKPKTNNSFPNFYSLLFRPLIPSGTDLQMLIVEINGQHIFREFHYELVFVDGVLLNMWLKTKHMKCVFAPPHPFTSNRLFIWNINKSLTQMWTAFNSIYAWYACLVQH